MQTFLEDWDECGKPTPAPRPTSPPNAALAYQVLDQITAHPELWNQGAWMARIGCNTVACFAGWATLLSGDQPQRDPRFDDLTGFVIGAHGAPMTVRRRATELLNISEWDADNLFGGSNELEDLKAYVAEIFGPRPIEGLPSVATDATMRECLPPPETASPDPSSSRLLCSVA